jgi:polar amino acid transport system substrate-binding protein
MDNTPIPKSSHFILTGIEFAILNLLGLFWFVLISPAASTAAELTVLTENLPNLNYIDNGKLVGYSVDVVKEIQRRTDSSDEIKVLPWARAYNMALKDENTVLFSVTLTDERKDLFKWICPLITKRDILIALKDSDLSINNIEDAKRVDRIGTIRGDSKERLLLDLGFRNLEPVSSEPQNLNKLMLGRIDLWVNKQPGLKATCEQAGIAYGLIKEVLHLRERDLCIAFSKGTLDSVVAAWQTAFEDMNKDGTIERMQSKWNLD